MESKFEILNTLTGFLGSVFKNKKGVRDTAEDRVNRDWKLIFIIFIIINIAAITSSAYLFNEINKGEIFLVETPLPKAVNTIDKIQLQEILFTYEEKTRKFEAIKKRKPTLIDPSL